MITVKQILEGKAQEGFYEDAGGNCISAIKGNKMYAIAMDGWGLTKNMVPELALAVDSSNVLDPNFDEDEVNTMLEIGLFKYIGKEFDGCYIYWFDAPEVITMDDIDWENAVEETWEECQQNLTEYEG